jgi:hypothetical protein
MDAAAVESIHRDLRVEVDGVPHLLVSLRRGEEIGHPKTGHPTREPQPPAVGDRTYKTLALWATPSVHDTRGSGSALLRIAGSVYSA